MQHLTRPRMRFGHFRPLLPFPLDFALAFALAFVIAGVFVPAASAWGQSATSRVTGVVVDSITGKPLQQAVVQLVSRADRGRSFTARTDADGRFTIDSVARGRYVAGFLHPRLDSLFIAAPVRELDIPGSGTVRTNLFVPSRRALYAAHCGPGSTQDSNGVFLGRVRSASDGAQAAAASVSIRWLELSFSHGIRRQKATVSAQTDSLGAFAICGMPSATRLLVQASSARDTSGLVELDMPASGLLLRDLYVGTFQSVAIAFPAPADGASDTLSDSLFVLRGPGRLRGRVHSENGRPVTGASVRVRGTEAAAITNEAGSYSLASTPTGTHALEVAAIGFQPKRVAVDIADGSVDMQPADVVLQPVGPLLDTVRVFGTRDRQAPWEARFAERKKIGLGRFIDESTVEKRDPMTITDLLSTTPGLVVRAGAYTSHSTLMMHDRKGGYCFPSYVVDGFPLNVGDASVDSFVSARQVRAVEIYRGFILTPSEFPRSQCGVIVIWTGMRKSGF